MNKKMTFLQKTPLPLCFLLTVISLPTMALTDKKEIKTSEHSNYPAQFFAQYQPQSAYSMIQRLPGFNFDGGDNARGFGGNAGNVLIDGARPTSKSGGLSGALKRIPAKQVERIEIIRGGISGGDAAGQSIVANVIKRTDITTGTYALKFRRAPHGDLQPNIEAAINTNIGQWASVFDIDMGFGPGYRDAIINNYDANNELTTSARETRKDLGRFSFANGQMLRHFDAGKLTLNGRVGADKWKNNQNQDIYNNQLADDSASDSQYKLIESKRFETAEFGIDWVAKFGDWKLHSLGLGQIETDKFTSGSNTFENDITTGFDIYSNDSYQSEYIIRNTYGYVGSNKLKPEYGLEIANNYLRKSSAYAFNGIVEELDNANVKVTEIRAELFANFVYTYSDAFSIDGGLTAELSEIEVIGDEVKKQEFNFIKPRISATYKFNDTTTFVIEAERVIEQLNFNDFAASSSTIDGRSVSGNSNLKPEQSNELSASLDWNYSEKGSLKVNAFHHWRDDVLEEIILSSGGQGLGNAGSAKVWGFETDISIPLDWILNNGLLEVSYNYIDSEHHDLIIQSNRNLSDQTPIDFSAELRQDLVEHKIAWGINYYHDSENLDYLVDEIENFEGNKRTKIFIESTHFDDYKVQLEVSNLNVAKYTRTRNFFVNDRSGEPNGVEISNRRREPVYKLSIWGTF